MTKNISINLEGKSLLDLKQTLRQLKLYKDLIKKLGSRGKNIFDLLVNNKSFYRVEYFSGISEKEALIQAVSAYKKAFGEDINENDIVLKKKNKLDGGIRVFKNDELLDLSFNKIEKKIKN